MASPRPADVGTPARFSPMWTASIVAVLVVSASLATAAAVLTIESLRPVGEGQLLSTEALTTAGELGADLEAGFPMGEAVRRARNELEIDAISVLDADGVVMASTSDTLLGSVAVQPLQIDALAEGRFTALAARIDVPLQVDGVTTLEPGSGVYLSAAPLDPERSVLLVYDMGELLARREAGRRAPEHVETLVAGAAVAVLVAAVIAIARRRARRSHEHVVAETAYLRTRAAVLQSDNEELTRARAEVERALALAEEKNRIRAEFVLMINHELRTPLTAVVTGARLLETSSQLSGADRDLVHDLVHEGERLDGLIGQMLAVARVENRGLSVNPVAQDLPELLTRLDGAHRLAEVQIADGFRPDGVQVVTDATTLVQLIASLVDNAVTHGARNVAILVDDRLPEDVRHVVGLEPGESVHVMVVDDGPGIDPDFLPRAFEKFEKQSFSSGTGLGLYLARMMAESIGSAISVATSSAGTTMAVALPVVRARQPVA